MLEKVSPGVEMQHLIGMGVDRASYRHEDDQHRRRHELKHEHDGERALPAHGVRGERSPHRAESPSRAAKHAERLTDLVMLEVQALSSHCPFLSPRASGRA